MCAECREKKAKVEAKRLARETPEQAEASIELCRMCTEYSADTRCEHKKDCKLQKILTENKALRAENKELRTKAFRNSWEKSPDMMGR